MSIAILHTYLANLFEKHGIPVSGDRLPMIPAHTVQLVVAKDVYFDIASSMPRLWEFMGANHPCVWRSATIQCQDKDGFLFSHINMYV